MPNTGHVPGVVGKPAANNTGLNPHLMMRTAMNDQQFQAYLIKNGLVGKVDPKTGIEYGVNASTGKTNQASTPTQASSTPVNTATAFQIPKEMPTPEQIAQQYQQQLGLLQQQQQQFSTEFANAFQKLQGEYSQSVSLLNSQYQQREQTNLNLLNVLQQQSQAAQRAQAENQAKYDALLAEQNKQVSLLDTLQRRASANTEAVQKEGIETAMQQFNLSSRRKVAASQASKNRANPGVYNMLTKRATKGTTPVNQTTSLLR